MDVPAEYLNPDFVKAEWRRLRDENFTTADNFEELLMGVLNKLKGMGSHIRQLKGEAGSRRTERVARLMAGRLGCQPLPTDLALQMALADNAAIEAWIKSEKDKERARREGAP